MAPTVANVEGHVRTFILTILRAHEEDVSAATSFAHLGADSLDIVSLIIAVADEFDLDIPDEAVPQITTVGELIEYVLPAGCDSAPRQSE